MLRVAAAAAGWERAGDPHTLLYYLGEERKQQMKGFAFATTLALLLGTAGAAGAATAVIDFADPGQNKDAAIVANADGQFTEVTQKGRKGVQTGAGGGQYLYINVTDNLFQGARALYLNVEYFNAGTDSFRVEYNGAVDDGSGELVDDIAAVGNPPVKVKSDTQTWTSQVFTLANPRLAGGLDGSADIRIDDMGDGPEIIGRITISDVDPRRPNIPQVSASNPIAIDGKKAEGEWANAYTFTLNAAEFDAVDARAWSGPEDFSGTYSFKWGAEGLYILGEVIDDDPLYADRDNLWENDGIELYIGLDQSNPGRTTYLAETDFQVITAFKETPLRVIYHGTSGVEAQGPEPVPGGVLAVTKTENGYMFEYLLRWDYIKPGFTPQLGQEIGFNMFGNDSDGDVGGQDTAMTPFKGKEMYRNPSAWVTATLVGS
jgi:hypothetical protein